MSEDTHCGESSSAPGVVAFTATLNIEDSYPKGTGVLKFKKVLINEGSAYKPGTGIFTCPVDGVYSFNVHLSVCGIGQGTIVKNGEKVVSLYHSCGKNSQVATISSMIKLSEGEEVWVELFGPGRNDIFATKDNDTVFTGFRLG